jgi:hypothetical protein
MQFIVQVGEQIHLPPVPSNFPRCGILKGPSFLFWYIVNIHICNVVFKNKVYLFLKCV